MTPKKRKYTRKQLKKPDDFISFSHKTWTWITAHTTQVIMMLAVAGVIIAGASVWTYFSESRAKDATRLLSRGIEIYEQPVIPSLDELPKEDDGIPRFPTRPEKLKAAEKAYSDVLAEHGSHPVGAVALLMRAGVRYELGKYDGAIKDYQKYLETEQHHGTTYFRTTALEGLTYAFEGRKMWDHALKTVAKMPKDGEGRFTILYHEARITKAKGDMKGARKRYKEIVEKAKPNSPVNKQAGQHLALLEGQ